MGWKIKTCLSEPQPCQCAISVLKPNKLKDDSAQHHLWHMQIAFPLAQRGTNLAALLMATDQLL